MALNFPNSPTLNQEFPSPAVAGIPVWRWDGIRWRLIAGPGGGGGGAVVANPPLTGEGIAGDALGVTMATAAQINTGTDDVYPVDSAGLRTQTGAAVSTLATTAKTIVPALNELNGQKTTVGDSPPTPAQDGRLWCDSVTMRLHVYFSSHWIEIGYGGT